MGRLFPAIGTDAIAPRTRGKTASLAAATPSLTAAAHASTGSRSLSPRSSSPLGMSISEG